MPHYLLSVHMPAEAPSSTEPAMPPSEEEMAQMMAAQEAFEARLPWRFSARLHGPEAATVVRRGDDGGRIVSDGPYVEAKEHMGGFYIIEAEDLDEALDWAEETMATIGMPALQVWPIAAAKQQSAEPQRS